MMARTLTDARRAEKVLMKLTNDSYLISLGTTNFTELYYRDADGWLKVSARGRTFRLTAEQVLNHLLPALIEPRGARRSRATQPPQYGPRPRSDRSSANHKFSS